MSTTRPPYLPRATARITLWVGAALVLAACGQAGDEGTASGPPADGAAADEGAEAGGVAPSALQEPALQEPALQVVATLAPVADLVAQVGGERVAVEPLVPAGVDVHTYEPRPSDVMTLADADLYIGIGLALNDQALRLAEEHLPADSRLALLGERALGEADLVFDHGHSHEGDDAGHTHGDDGHTHGDGGDGALAPNPHLWTSLVNTRALVAALTETLSEQDPAGAGAYAVNRDRYLDRIDALHARIQAAVDTIPESARSLITYHDAWAYFARDHGLAFETAVQPADFTDPSASEVRAVIDLVRAREIPAVFGSEEFPTPVLEAIAEETGARYLDGLADDALPGRPGDPEHTYLELMRRNARTIVEGLGGDPGGLDAP